MSVLITGAAGVIGQRLVKEYESFGSTVHATDILWHDRHLDVTDADEVDYWLRTIKPATVIHLAAAKDAPQGELDPFFTTTVNLDGTVNVVNAAKAVGAHVVLTSTCKAADPETAYGASKLIAERAVLNEGGTVTRFFNVPETAGNVFRLWESIPEHDPIPYTDCWRYFTPLPAAVRLARLAAAVSPGRYIFHPGVPQHMADVARARYPRRELVEIPRRRGDRVREPLHAACEHWTPLYELDSNWFGRIESPYDAAR